MPGRPERARHLIQVLLLACAIPVPAMAQDLGTLRGRVIDELGRPVQWAQVELRPGDRRVQSGSDGVFVVQGVDRGEYEVRVRRIGYQPASVPLTMPMMEPLVITLSSLPRVLDSVIIRERASSLRYTGIVLDDRDQPVVDAEVIAAGASDRGVRTDPDGHFRLLKAQKGTIMLRIRKFGYAPYFGSLTLRGEREDTIRMPRHPEGLPRAYILAESGFGRDTFAYAELASRLSWKLSSARIVSREQLDEFGDGNLCEALARFAEMREDDCSTPRCILVDGLRPVMQALWAFKAHEVESVEVHARDWSGTLASRFGLVCRTRTRDAGGLVLWLRRQPP